MDTLATNEGLRLADAGRYQRAEAAQREQAIIESLFERKHFPDILELMYREKMMRQKDIVEALGISKGVVCLNMNQLNAVGFIGQRKTGRCKTYNLLKKGAEYYETHYLRGVSSEEIAVPEKTGEKIRRYLGEGAETLQDTLVSILERIDGAIEKLSEDGNERVWMQRARESMEDAEQLSQAFYTVAERNDMLLYYYMGEYQAKVSWLKGKLYEQRDGAAQQAVVRGKYFETVLRLLYDEGTILKKDMIERLGISPGNTFLHLKGMIEAGFVEEGRDGMCRSYRLSPDGARYYEEKILKPGRKAEPLGAGQEKCVRQRKKPETVLNERNFSGIMRILYEAGDIQLSDLCTRLDRPHGNVYRDMQNLTVEGFVKKETVRHCNYYALSDKGKEYCEEVFC